MQGDRHQRLPPLLPEARRLRAVRVLVIADEPKLADLLTAVTLADRGQHRARATTAAMMAGLTFAPVPLLWWAGGHAAHSLSMNWGDVPAWVAVALSLAASGQAWWARRKAREATAGAASLEVSLQRIADVLERSQGAAPSHRSGVSSSDLPTGASESSPALPEFNVEYVSGHAYRLRNVSTVRATGVTVAVEQAPAGLTRKLPAGADLPPFASTSPFVIQGSMQAPAPGEVLVACDQLPESVRVPLPPRG